jgi:hypothetical protein
MLSKNFNCAKLIKIGRKLTFTIAHYHEISLNFVKICQLLLNIVKFHLFSQNSERFTLDFFKYYTTYNIAVHDAECRHAERRYAECRGVGFSVYQRCKVCLSLFFA